MTDEERRIKDDEITKNLKMTWKGQEVTLQEYMELGARQYKYSKNKPAHPNRKWFIDDKKKEQIRRDLKFNPSMKDVARRHKIPYDLVRKISNELPDEHESYRQKKVEKMIDDLYELSDEILGKVTVEDIQKASLKDKALASAIIIDKARVLGGEPTEFIGQYVTDRELIIIAREAGVDLPAAIKQRVERVVGTFGSAKELPEEVKELREAEQA